MKTMLLLGFAWVFIRGKVSWESHFDEVHHNNNIVITPTLHSTWRGPTIVVTISTANRGPIFEPCCGALQVDQLHASIILKFVSH